jgi:hypothetical protein
MTVPDHNAACHACDCASHRAAEPGSRATDAWSAILPALACAACPACLPMYAKLFAVLGLGFELTELQHVLLLCVAITASLAVSTRRAWRLRRVWPVAIALSGSALIALSHVGGEHPAAEWAGILTLLVGAVLEHVRRPRPQSPQPSTA